MTHHTSCAHPCCCTAVPEAQHHIRTATAGCCHLRLPPCPPAAAAIEMKGIRLRGAPLYLDMQATTPLDPRVVDAMLPYMTEQVGGGQAVLDWDTGCKCRTGCLAHLWTFLGRTAADAESQAGFMQLLLCSWAWQPAVTGDCKQAARACMAEPGFVCTLIPCGCSIPLKVMPTS
jgi:hypothetical protein